MDSLHVRISPKRKWYNDDAILAFLHLLLPPDELRILTLSNVHRGLAPNRRG